MLAIDQYSRLSRTAEEQAEHRKYSTNWVVDRFHTMGSDETILSHPMEDFVDGPFAEKLSGIGYPVVAWGSGYFWTKINAQLEERKYPDIYNLIDRIHEHADQPVQAARDLDKLIQAYSLWLNNPAGAAFFKDIATRYFRNEPVKLRIAEAEADSKDAGGPAGSP
jgi:hypothetical protein